MINTDLNSNIFHFMFFIIFCSGADLLAMNVDGNMPYECCMPGPTLNLVETEMDKRG